MAAKILDGQKVAEEIKVEAKRSMIDKTGLAVLLCGNNPASEIYVNRKKKACEDIGVSTYTFRPQSLEELLSNIKSLNENPEIHGILAQLPLPKEFDFQSKNQYAVFDVFDAIDPLKDVDVFTPVNVGLLLQGRPRLVPCTPLAIQELLSRHGIQIAGKKVCVINRSNIFGKPLSSLLIQDADKANATVVTCHDRTPSDLLKKTCLASDIVIVAVGQPNFLTADMITESSIVVDVGITKVEKKVVGDVHPEVYQKADWVSLVPGGVGPVTVACLLRNVIKCQKMLYDQHIISTYLEKGS